MDTRTGRVTRNAEAKQLKGGKNVVNFSIAIDRSYLSKEGEQVKNTEYVECAYWNREKIAPYLLKGILVEVEGNMGARAYLKGGEANAVLTMNVRDLKFHEKRKNGTAAPAAKATSDAAADDLPF